MVICYLTRNWCMKGRKLSASLYRSLSLSVFLAFLCVFVSLSALIAGSNSVERSSDKRGSPYFNVEIHNSWTVLAFFAVHPNWEFIGLERERENKTEKVRAIGARTKISTYCVSCIGFEKLSPCWIVVVFFHVTSFLIFRAIISSANIQSLFADSETLQALSRYKR